MGETDIDFPDSPNSGVTRILHLDDDPADHILFKKNVKKVDADLEILWYSTCSEAEKALDKFDVHCIICDFQMPDLDGIQFLGQIREKHGDLPFIFYTGQGNEQVAAQAFRSGADDYYTKNEGFAHYQRIVASIIKNVRAYRNRSNYRFAINALRKSDERLSIAGKALYDVMYDWDLLSNRISWFNKFEESLGYEKGEIDISLDGWENLLHPDDKIWLLPQLEKDKTEGKILNYEYRMRAKDGSYRFWQERGYPQKDEGGQIVRWIGVCRDITEKKELEKKLQHQVDILEEAQQIANLGTYSLDFASSIWESSQVLDQIFGISKDYIRNVEGWLNLVHKDDRERMLDHLQNHVIAGQNPFDAEYRIVRNDNGKTAWVHGTGKIYREDSGKPLTMIGAIMDITNSKSYQAELMSENEKFRTLLDAMPVLAVALDQQGNIIYWNDECARVSGYSSEQMCNNPGALELLIPDETSRKRVGEIILNNSEDFENMEISSMGKDGQEKIVAWYNVSNKNPIRGWHVWAVGFDKTAENKSRNKIIRLQHCLEQAEGLTKMGSWIWDLKTMDHQWSKEMYSICEIPEGRGPTKSVAEWLDLIHPDDRAKVTNNINSVLDNNGKFISDDFRMVTPTGKTKHLSLKGRVVREKDEVGKIYGAIVDVTEQKLTETSLRKAYSKIKQSHEDLKAFSYTVSHDLKSPLRQISGFAEILNNDCADCHKNDSVALLALICDACKKMDSLINDILELSLSQRREVTRTEVDLSRLGQEIIQKLATASPDRKYKYLYEAKLLVLADSGLTKILLENLLNNAWKYTSGRDLALIEFGLENRQGKDYFFIRDNGIGIEKDKETEVFKPFTRLNTHLKVEGSGIGLATVKTIIEAHQGEIFLESQPEKGTIVYFTLNPSE